MANALLIIYIVIGAWLSLSFLKGARSQGLEDLIPTHLLIIYSLIWPISALVYVYLFFLRLIGFNIELAISIGSFGVSLESDSNEDDEN